MNTIKRKMVINDKGASYLGKSNRMKDGEGDEK